MRIFSIATLLLALTGCMATTQNAMNNQYKTAVEAESNAWQKAFAMTADQCGQYNASNPLPPEKSIEVANCFEKIVIKEVAPKAINQILLNDYIVAYKNVALDYKKKKIGRDEANIRTQQAFNDYLKSLDSQYRTDMQNAYQHDANINAQRAQALQNMSNQMAIQEQQNQIKNTNCSVMGDGWNCTTW